jgi:hypothetical protein
LKQLLSKDQRLALENELQAARNQGKIIQHQMRTVEAETVSYKRHRTK